MNIRNMFVVIGRIPDAMVGKSLLPYFHVGAEFDFCAMRKAAFEVLDRSLQRASGCDQRMEVIGHYDKRMKLVGLCAVVVKGVNK